MSDVSKEAIMKDAEKEPASRWRHAGAIVLHPARVAQVLLGVTALLVLVHLTGNALALEWDNTLTRVLLIEFSVNGEATVPAFFSTVLLLCASLSLVAVAAKRREAAYAGRWALLAAIFLFLALDEAAGVHEYFSRPFREVLGVPGFLYYAWVIPASFFVIVLLAYYLQFLRHLPARTRRLFILAGVLYVGGAIGVELLGAQYYSVHGDDDLTYALIVAVEETGEMVGVITFIYALLEYLRRLPGSIHVCIERGKNEISPSLK